MQLLPTDQAHSKKQARELFLSARASISYKDTATMSQAVCDRLLGQIKLLDVRTVLLFFPVRREPNIFPLMELLSDIGIRTAFPVSHKNDTTLEFRYVKRIEDFLDGAYGIKEPKSSCETVTDFSACACIVPALAFDKKGTRIGYGKGYYDRFLKDFCGISIGVAFSSFVVDALPEESTDVPIDLIVTEGGVIIPNEKEYAPQKHS